MRKSGTADNGTGRTEEEVDRPEDMEAEPSEEDTHPGQTKASI